MSCSRTIAVLACALLAGCASIVDRHPKITYADKRHPLADTAIFSCVGSAKFTCGIVRVDDTSTWNHYNGGERVWVRVLPGEHRITVVASNNRDVNWLSFDAQGVQPGHAYSIEIADASSPAVAPATSVNKPGAAAVGAELSASYQDLGKMDAYTIRLGEHTIHVTKLTADF
jgi:hypothetical protein